MVGGLWAANVCRGASVQWRAQTAVADAEKLAS